MKKSGKLLLAISKDMKFLRKGFSYLKKIDVIIEIISGLFILLFVYAALGKVLDFQKFRVELGKSPILSYLADLVSYSIPAIELLISILLTIKRFRYVALYAAFSLMTMFSAYIIVILNFSSYIPCSCGGVLQNMTWSQHLVFNLIFCVFGTIAILIYPANKTLSAQ